MALPNLATAKSSTTWRVFRFFVVVWGVQALWVWFTQGVMFTPDQWAAWWIDAFATAVRFINDLFTEGDPS
jgi:hypothetical protein